MRKLTILFLLMLMQILYLSGCAHIGEVTESGFNITFHNTTEETVIYRLAWIDHDFKDRNGFPYLGPVEMAVGELGPNKKSEVKNGYRAGLWSITWYDCRSNEPWEIKRNLTISKDIHHLLTTPKEDTLK